MSRLYEVLDMVGGAFDAGWVDVFTARDLIAEYGHVDQARAMSLLMFDGQAPPPAPDWNGWNF